VIAVPAHTGSWGSAIGRGVLRKHEHAMQQLHAQQHGFNAP
jgi:hypothetical protein